MSAGWCGLGAPHLERLKGLSAMAMFSQMKAKCIIDVPRPSHDVTRIRFLLGLWM